MSAGDVPPGARLHRLHVLEACLLSPSSISSITPSTGLGPTTPDLQSFLSLEKCQDGGHKVSEVLSTLRERLITEQLCGCELISVSYVHMKGVFSRCNNALWLLRVTSAGACSPSLLP